MPYDDRSLRWVDGDDGGSVVCGLCVTGGACHATVQRFVKTQSLLLRGGNETDCLIHEPGGGKYPVVSSPSALWGGAAAEIEFAAFSLKISHHAATVLMIFPREPTYQISSSFNSIKAKYCPL